MAMLSLQLGVSRQSVPLSGRHGSNFSTMDRSQARHALWCHHQAGPHGCKAQGCLETLRLGGEYLRGGDGPQATGKT